MEKEILEYIRNADGLQANDLLLEIHKRYQTLYPDHNIYLFTLPKYDEAERHRQLAEILERIQ